MPEPEQQSPTPTDPNEWLGVERDLNALPRESARVVVPDPDRHFRWHIESVDRPAGVSGHLAEEVSLLQTEASTYVDPMSYMGQRTRMAIQVRESALATLATHEGDKNAALQALKRERRHALSHHDSMTAENTDREVAAIRRAGSTHYIGAEATVRQITSSRLIGRDPQFNERGVIGGLAFSVLRAFDYRLYTSTLNNQLMYVLNPENLRLPGRQAVALSIATRAMRLSKDAVRQSE